MKPLLVLLLSILPNAVLAQTPAAGGAQAEALQEAAPPEPLPGPKPGIGLEGWRGPLRVASADAPGPLKVGLGTYLELLSADGLLVEGDEDSRFVGTLVVNVVPADFVETFAILRARANRNSMGRPELIQSLGDFSLGAKGFYPVLPFLSVGGLGRLDFLNGVGDLGWTAGATSFHALALATLDARVLDPDAIVRAHLNLGYSFENGHSLVGDRPLTVQEQFGGNVVEFDMVNVALAIEVLPEPVTPFIEWGLRVPVGTRVDTPDVCTGDMPCPSEEGFASFPHWLTLGLAKEVLTGLTLRGAVDIGLTGRIVGGIPPVPRYNVVLGLVYDLCGCGEGSGVPCVQQPIRPVEPARPPQGDILGRVVDASTRLPLPGARITYPQHTRTDQLTGPDGVFQSYDFPPGPVRKS